MYSASVLLLVPILIFLRETIPPYLQGDLIAEVQYQMRQTLRKACEALVTDFTK